MAASSYYDQTNLNEEKTSVPSTLGHQQGATALDQTQTSGLIDGQRGYPQQGYNQQGQGTYNQQGYNEQSGGVYNNEQQPPVGNGGNVAQSDNRDALTKWLDKIEHKFGGERFNNPANAEKNRKLNENILKRLKQVGKLVM